MEISRDLEISRVLNFLQPLEFSRGGLEISRSWKFPGPLENSRILDISRPPGKIQGGPYLRSDTLCICIGNFVAACLLIQGVREVTTKLLKYYSDEESSNCMHLE